MRILFVVALFLAVTVPCSFAADNLDWTDCKDDIKKFRCDKAQTNHDMYRCLIEYDGQLSKECVAVTVEYERTVNKQ